MVVVLLVGLLMVPNVSYGGNGGDALATIGDVKSKSFSSATNNGGNVNIDIGASPLIPAPILDIPGFVAPAYERIDYWTHSPFTMKKTRFSTKELTRFANPSKVFGLFGYEWNKGFKIEIACWEKGKAQKVVDLYQYTDANSLAKVLSTYTKIGEAQGRAKKLCKSERQVAAALAYKVAKLGARVVVVHSFSTPVTKAHTAVLGGAGANVSPHNIINGAGGFGTSTAEKVARAYVVAEFYR